MDNSVNGLPNSDIVPERVFGRIDDATSSTSTPRSISSVNSQRRIINNLVDPSASEQNTPRRFGCNPFEMQHDLITLQGCTFSPSVFTTVRSPSDNIETDGGPFRWSIEHMAMLNPADIENSPALLYAASHKFHPDIEQKVQASIDKFFSDAGSVLASPWSVPDSAVRTFAQSALNSKASRKGSQVACLLADKSVQTMVSFPPNCDFTALVGAAFVGDDDAANSSAESSNSSGNLSLRRKLFQPADSEQKVGVRPEELVPSESPDLEQSHGALMFGSSNMTPVKLRSICRTSSTPVLRLRSPDLSPVKFEDDANYMLSSSKATTSLFSDNCSANLTVAPDQSSKFGSTFDTNSRQWESDAGYLTGSYDLTPVKEELLASDKKGWNPIGASTPQKVD